MLANKIVYKSPDIEITIITLGSGVPFFPLDDRIKVVPLNMQGQSSSMYESIKHTFSIIRNLRKIIKKHDFDLIISFLTRINLIAILATRRLKVPLIISEHTVHDVASRSLIVFRRIFYPLADYLTVLVKYDKAYYDRFCKKVKVMANPNPLSTKKLSKQSIIDRPRVIIGVGRLHPVKGFDMLVNSFSMISDRFPDWELHLIGEGQERMNLENQIEELSLQKRIKLTGRIENVLEVYRNAQIFALSSRFEGFGLALVEAMSQGLACVSFNCKAGPGEIISNNTDGVLVENGNVISFAEELSVLMQNEDLRIALSKKAILKSESFHEDLISDYWIDLIRFVKK